MPKTTFICPYCFERRKLTEVQFRCTNRRCKDFDDPEMTRYENGDLKMPKLGKRTFQSPGKNPFAVPASAKCPECHNVTFKRICPACHNELPESTLTGEDMIISIVGSRATGKSHFVGVIIKELMDRISVSFDGALEGFADSYKRWEANFGSKLYTNNEQKGEKLDLTRSSLQSVDNGAYRPLIFKLKLRNRAMFGRETIQSFTFVFFDTAGEDLNDEDTMSTVNKYICKSEGIVFLLDPLQIPAVYTQLDASTVSRASGGLDPRNVGGADDIMTRVSRLIRNDRRLSETAKIDIPVAAAFSKFDVIEPILPPDCVIRSPSPHCSEKCFDLSDWHNVNSEIRSLLQEWNANAFISQLEMNYTNYSYFAVSALGLNNNPTTDGRIDRPRPHRIEDPILWILNQKGIIKGRK